MIDLEKSIIDTEVRQVVTMPAFEIFVGKVLEYLDEVYYIEKKRGIFEAKGQGNQPVVLLASEKERLALKSSECAYAYSGVLFKTVWKPNLKWDVSFPNNDSQSFHSYLGWSRKPTSERRTRISMTTFITVRSDDD